MRNLIRCRRGASSFVVVLSLFPLIGFVALGAEAGSWYITRQQAQNAADAAAYAGALRLACSLANGGPTAICPTDGQTVDYRGKEFAGGGGFCDSKDTTKYPNGVNCVTLGASLPTKVSQSVAIATLAAWNGNSGNFIQATVSQTQPPYLAKVIGWTSNVTVGAQAIAQVNKLANPCVLALSGAITFHDSAVTVDAPTCGFASNSTGVGFDFSGNPTRVNVASMSTSGSCTGGSTYCSKVLTYMPPVTDPFAPLDTALSALNTSSWKACSSLAAGAYSATNQCYNSGGGQITASGVYFFNGLTLKGSSSLSIAPGKAATIILLPGTSLWMTGNSTLTVTGQTSVPASELPASLQSVASLLNNVAFYDTESGAPKINGNPTINFDGVWYTPNMDLSYKGHPTINAVNTSGNNCSELFAASIEFIGSPTFTDTGCSPSIEPVSQIVKLVQ